MRKILLSQTCIKEHPPSLFKVILRNAGDGRSFDTLDVPSVTGGSEDDVIALDYDADGRSDFLALNGRNSERGPVQLITLRPA